MIDNRCLKLWLYHLFRLVQVEMLHKTIEPFVQEHLLLELSEHLRVTCHRVTEYPIQPAQYLVDHSHVTVLHLSIVQFRTEC